MSSERELRRALLARQMTEAQGPGQPRVAGRPIGQHEQVIAVRIGSMMIGHQTGGDLLLGVVLAEHLPAETFWLVLCPR